LGDFRPKKCRFSGPKSPLLAEFWIKDRRSPIPASASLDFGAQFCADSCDFDEKSKAPPRKTAFSAPKHAFRPKKVDARGSFSRISAEIWAGIAGSNTENAPESESAKTRPRERQPRPIRGKGPGFLAKSRKIDIVNVQKLRGKSPSIARVYQNIYIYM
jgi:hypothetical protein